MTSSATDLGSDAGNSAAGERSALWRAVNVLGSPEGAETTPEGRAYSRAIGDVLDVIEKHDDTGGSTAGEMKRLRRVEKAAIRLLNFFARSVNAGPLSKDPSAEGRACRELRDALKAPVSGEK